MSNKKLEDEIVAAGISLGKQAFNLDAIKGAGFLGARQDEKRIQEEYNRRENRLRSLIRQIQQPKMEDR